MPAVSVQCPHCSHSYSVDDSLVNRRGRCKTCGKVVGLATRAEHVCDRNWPEKKRGLRGQLVGNAGSPYV
jgi:predicted Zn finger-like uncharacterized protein